MEVEQQLLLLVVCGVETVAAFVVDDPEHGQHDGGEQEDRWEDNDEDVLAPWTALPSGLGVFIVSSEIELFA